MKCPHCEYLNDPAEFYQTDEPIMSQGYPPIWNNKVYLYACPECGKTFILV